MYLERVIAHPRLGGALLFRGYDRQRAYELVQVQKLSAVVSDSLLVEVFQLREDGDYE